MISIQVTGIREAQSKFRSMARAFKDNAESLFIPLGGALVADVQARIVSSDHGSWAPASKWLRAKSGQSKVLKDTEKTIKMRVLKTELRITGKGGRWTLTQHHEGFENELSGPGDEFDSRGRVVLRLKDPRPLNLYATYRRRRAAGPYVALDSNLQGEVEKGTFAFVPHRRGKTPPRKIWPTDAEVHRIMDPMAARWAKRVAEESK